jgi:hypothetical protein
VLSKAGDHVPVIPLFDVVGNALKLSPEQIALTALNVGVTFAFTVIVLVAVIVPQLPPVVVSVNVIEPLSEVVAV